MDLVTLGKEIPRRLWKRRECAEDTERRCNADADAAAPRMPVFKWVVVARTRVCVGMHRVDHAGTLESHSLEIFAEVGPEVAQQDACADSNLQSM